MGEKRITPTQRRQIKNLRRQTKLVADNFSKKEYFGTKKMVQKS